MSTENVSQGSEATFYYAEMACVAVSTLPLIPLALLASESSRIVCHHCCAYGLPSQAHAQHFILLQYPRHE